MRAPRLVCLWISVAICAAGAGPASAADPDAPPGAPPSWLPDEPWVMKRWVPMDEQQMARALGFDSPYLLRLQLVDADAPHPRSPADVARRRGRSASRVIDGLMRPWRTRATPAQRAVLRVHMRRMFSQPHLAIHMMSHAQHVNLTAAQWTGVFGVPPDAVNADVARGLTRLEVAQRHRGAAAPVERDLRAAYARIAQDGVRRRQMLPSEARIVRANQNGWLPHFWHESAPIPCGC